MPNEGRPYRIYIALVSLIGFILSAVGFWQLIQADNALIFVLLSLLATGAQSTATFLVEGGISVSVSSTVNLAIVPLYGAAAAAFSAAISEAGLWLINVPKDRENWKGTLPQLTFNMGMAAIALYGAGLVFLLGREWLGPQTLAGQTLPWLIAAIVADQLNIWLLIGILYFQRGLDPLEVWVDHRWAMSINVVVMSVGGAVLALAVEEFGLLGISIFFLPIVLSAYAFRLYVRRTHEQMDQLEEIVAARTQALANVNKELAGLNEQKDAFLAVLTHDMRSPLTNIHGYAAMLRDHPEFPPDQRTYMAEIILRNERALLEIVNNILDIEHLESGAPVLLDRENFDLANLIADVVELSEAQAQEKKIEVSTRADSAPLFLNADRQKVARILQNLVSNAIKYTPEEGHVSITVEMNGHHAVVSVEDTGYGIPAEELPHIFDRYSRVAKHRHKAIGTGLGLTIVKSLVEAHGGEISVTSEEGAGSTFTITLPS